MRDGLGDLHPSRAVARRMHELETELQHARTHLRRHSKSPNTTGRWGLEQPSAPRQEEVWFITYLDMMTLLLVVMIVMLAFSGALGTTSLPQAMTTVTAPPPDAGDATPAAATHPLADSTLHEDPADIPGLLPGGTGLLPGHDSMASDAAAEPIPADTPTMAHPADIGPLPSDALILAGKTAGPLVPPPLPSLPELYPGWGAADLAASFIGPPRPTKAPSTAPVPGDETTAGTQSDAQMLTSTRMDDAIQAPSEAAISPAAASPSEGEAIAASLALGELGSDVEIVISERSVSLRVNSEILFDSSQADLSRSGLSVLRNILGVLSKTNGDITIEGHTDSVPVRRNVRYPSNWELSSARAGSVVRYLQANGVQKTRLKAIGYADTRPIADNHTPDGRARNRRVELVIEKPALN
ncbi:MAG: OmpA family protein [Burkholderiaceae bacterium]